VYSISKEVKQSEDYAQLDDSLSLTLYNGEIFDVISVENVRIKTQLNRYSYVGRYFDGQILQIQRINDDLHNTYEILHIPPSVIEEARKKIKAKEKRLIYMHLFTNFIKIYPKLTYGYCITIYKSQGSEWKNVFVNLPSIKWSIVRKNEPVDTAKKKALFRATYTAMTRASHTLHLFWSK
jgi:hypothetical protein